MFSCKKVNFLLNTFSANLIKKNADKYLIKGFCQKADENVNPEKSVKLNKAMKAYLERARSYNQFIKEEDQKFNLGKRHLANMMGLDPQTITQEQIDESIEYLFPSGLFEKKARPLMKPPMVVFPPRKEAQFDETGRPYHYLFYTGRPYFYGMLHDFVEHMQNLDNVEDEKLKTMSEQQNMRLDVTGSQWLEKDELENIMVEQVTDTEYKNFLSAGERLVAHRYSSLVKDFIMKFRKPVVEMTMSFDAPKPEVDIYGREFITVKDCPRKNAKANVTVRRPGTGLISINGKDIEYFSTIQSRNQLLYPLDLTGLNGAVDIEATVTGGGETGQAGAIRWGISWALRSFVSNDMIESMRLAGLLTRDFRRRERKKPGQAKARKKFTWKKR